MILYWAKYHIIFLWKSYQQFEVSFLHCGLVFFVARITTTDYVKHTGLRQSTESWQLRTESPHLLRPQGLKVLQERGFAKLQYVVPAADSLTPACQTCVSSYTDEADACLCRRLLHNMQYVDLSAFL